jgi:hypothetical protein
VRRENMLTMIAECHAPSQARPNRTGDVKNSIMIA